MKLKIKFSVVLVGVILLTIIFTLLASGFFLGEEKLKNTEIKSIVIKAEGGLGRKVIDKELNWVFVNKQTKQVVTRKTNGSINDVKLSFYEDSGKNDWLVSVKNESYSGIGELKNSDLQSGKFTIFLSKIQTAIDVTLTVQDSAIATTAIPIKWDIPKGFNAKINIQKEGDEPLFYAPPNLFTVNFKKNEAMLRMPSDAGKYVIRMYDTKHIKEPLKEVAINVLKANIKIIAPSEAIAGTSINLSWESPESSQGQINIKEKSKKVEYYSRYYVRTRGKKSVNLILPSKEGEYAFRWYDFYSKKLVTEKDIKIKKAEIEIYAKNKASVGEKVLVRWNTPKNLQATVYLRSEVDDKTVTGFTVAGKTKYEIVMPQKAGMYYLTWISDGDKQEMKRKTIEVIDNNNSKF